MSIFDHLLDHVPNFDLGLSPSNSTKKSLHDHGFGLQVSFFKLMCPKSSRSTSPLLIFDLRDSFLRLVDDLLSSWIVAVRLVCERVVSVFVRVDVSGVNNLVELVTTSAVFLVSPSALLPRLSAVHSHQHSRYHDNPGRLTSCALSRWLSRPGTRQF